MINILVQYQSVNLYIPFGNIQVIYLHWLNKIMFFQQSWNLLSSSFIKMESTTAYFSLFTELCLGTIKICKILCHNLNYHCAASSPYPGSSSDSANCSPICDCSEPCACTWGWAKLPGEELPPRRWGAVLSWAACSPWVEHTWSIFSTSIWEQYSFLWDQACNEYNELCQIFLNLSCLILFHAG